MAKDEGLRVDFSNEEAASEAMEFNPIPSGSYHVKITDIEDRESKSEKNPGAPYWAVEMVVQDGSFADRKLWANVMLFNGALYSLSQLLKATDNHDALKTGKIPAKETFISKDLIVVVRKMRDEYKERQEIEASEDGTLDKPIFKNEVKGFKKYEEGALAGAQSSGGSLLP